MLQLNPGNPFALDAYLETFDVDGNPIPLTVAAGIKAFWSVSKAVIAAADPALEVDVVYVGAANTQQRPTGTWLILFTAAQQSVARCDPLFGATRKAHLFVRSADVTLLHAEAAYVLREAKVIG